MQATEQGARRFEREATDEELLRQLAAGNNEALGPLYSRYAPLIFARASRALDAWAAEEVVQDVLLSVWRSAATYDESRGPARAWILQIARFRVINELRRRRRRPATQTGEMDVEALPDGGRDPADLAWRHDYGERLRAAMAELPEPQQEALGLAYFADLTHDQVARHLDVPLGTVKTRIRTGVQKLRVSLAPLVAGVAVVVAGATGWLWWQGHNNDEAVKQRDARALHLVTASDITNIRATAQPGAPPDAHATYRGRAGTTTAVVTLAHMAPLSGDQVYQIWAKHGDTWISLGTAHVDAGGSALLIVEGGRVLALPEALKVTIEHGHGSAQPQGTVVAAWSAQ